jgi:hypothetical protein
MAEGLERCPVCDTSLHDARVVCAGCGEELPLRVVLVSEGSQGGGFALVAPKHKEHEKEHERHEKERKGHAK